MGVYAPAGMTWVSVPGGGSKLVSQMQARQMQQQASQPTAAPAAPQGAPAGGYQPAATPNAPVSGAGFENPQTGYTIGGNVALPSQAAAPNTSLSSIGGQQPTDIMGQLQKVLQNPGDVASNPAYKFLQDQGAQMLQRQLGQTGQRFSGNALTAAQQYGQGLAGQYFGNLANTLGNAAQTQLSTWLQPAATQAGLNLGAYNAGNQAWNNLAQTLLGNYQANTQAAQQRTTAQYLGAQQNAAQGYNSLVPQAQNLLSTLQQNYAQPTGAQYGYSPTNPSPAEMASDASAFSNGSTQWSPAVAQYAQQWPDLGLNPANYQ